jgi:5-methylcytosine-specific restriction protein A
MPIINLPERKEKEYKRVFYTSTKKNNEIFKAVYNTNIWKNLRLEYLIHQPLCENCIEKGIVESAVEVHHKIPISQGKDILEKQTLGFDWNNLKSVCKECHKKEHRK